MIQLTFKINFNCKLISALQYATTERYDVGNRFPQEQKQVWFQFAIARYD